MTRAERIRAHFEASRDRAIAAVEAGSNHKERAAWWLITYDLLRHYWPNESYQQERGGL